MAVRETFMLLPIKFRNANDESNSKRLLNASSDLEPCSITAVSAKGECTVSHEGSEDVTTKSDDDVDSLLHAKNPVQMKIARVDSKAAKPMYYHEAKKDETSMGSEYFDNSQIMNEPLLPGDVITYTSPIFVDGTRLSTARILSVDPKKTYPLCLDNSELLPSDHFVYRNANKWGKHIEDYVLDVGSIAGDFDAATGVRRMATSIQGILQHGIREAQRRLKEDNGW